MIRISRHFYRQPIHKQVRAPSSAVQVARDRPAAKPVTSPTPHSPTKHHGATERVILKRRLDLAPSAAAIHGIGCNLLVSSPDCILASLLLPPPGFRWTRVRRRYSRLFLSRLYTPMVSQSPPTTQTSYSPTSRRATSPISHRLSQSTRSMLDAITYPPRMLYRPSTS